MSKCQNKLIYMLQNILDLMSCFPRVKKKNELSGVTISLILTRCEGNVDNILLWCAKKN